MEPVETIIFQEPVKIDLNKFLENLYASQPQFKSAGMHISSEQGVPVIRDSAERIIFLFQQEKEGYITRMDTHNIPMPTEEVKQAFRTSMSQILRNSIVTGREQEVVRNTTYETLTDNERQLYEHYENFRFELEERIVEARNGDKPVLLFAGEAHNYPTSVAFKYFSADIALEQGFNSLTLESQISKGFEEEYNTKPADSFYFLGTSVNTAIVYSTKMRLDRTDLAIPDVEGGHPKVFHIDLPYDDPLIVEARRTGDHSKIHTDEVFDLRNKLMVDNILQKTSGDVVHVGGYAHTRAIIEDPEIIKKFTVVPVALCIINAAPYHYIENGARREFKHIDIDYINGTLSENSYSNGKPYILKMDDTQGYGVVTAGTKPAEFMMLSRRFSKVYDDRCGGGQTKKLEDMIEASLSDKTSPGTIDRAELAKIADQIYILQKEFGKAISYKEEGTKLQIDIDGNKKDYTIKR